MRIQNGYTSRRRAVRVPYGTVHLIGMTSVLSSGVSLNVAKSYFGD